MAVSKRLRFEILRRDDHTCRYCGAQAPDVPLRVDHVVPVALGGTDDPSNLVTACEPCNTGKSSIAPDSPLVSDIAADALRWARAMATVAELRAAGRRANAELHDKFAAKWNSWTYTRGIREYTVPLPGDWRGTVTRFLEAGLELDDLTELVDVAMAARCDDVWRYFCGCCWRRITEAQERARELLDIYPDGTPGGLTND
jgi:hypothetical protein